MILLYTSILIAFLKFTKSFDLEIFENTSINQSINPIYSYITIEKIACLEILSRTCKTSNVTSIALVVSLYQKKFKCQFYLKNFDKSKILSSFNHTFYLKKK